MDRELSRNQLIKNRVKTGLRLAGIFLLIIIGLIILRQIFKPAIKFSRIMVATAEVGRIEDALTASGTVIPEFEQVVTSPIQSSVVDVFHQAGDLVVRGTAILQLNTEFVRLRRGRLLEELELQKNKKIQLNLALERNRTELQAQHDIKELNLELLQSKVNQAEHLHSIGAGSKDNLDQARLNLEIARRELKLLEQTIENEEKTLSADLHGVDLQIGIQENTIAEIDRQLELAEIRADRDGVITWVNDNIGSTVQAGDIVVRIADLTSYKVECQISDIHATKLKLGGPVRVRLGDRDLHGVISGIQPTIRGGIATFFIGLDDKTDQALRSNLRVDVFVITAFKDNIMRVKNGPFVDGPGRQDIFVVAGKKALRKTVDIGATNLDYVELKNFVAAGERIIISDMEKYKHLEAVAIKED
ncbi:MAG: HlyD family efflux transporter periplasmic adaptor subunit [Candidatus Neomarinimicrobiota bacterium]